MSLMISEVASAAGVNVQTLRYYERRGILEEPRRTPAGYRQYDPEDVKKVQFIKRAQDLGFTLEEVRELLGLRVLDGGDGAACADVEDRARAKLTDVDRRIRQLNHLRDVLTELIEACERRQPTEECPILDALERD
jgi:Hg(II)-responsive transcriptional regulator